ncbi:MAG: serine protease [Sulfurovum sp. FS06-10]|nr:MAG: serine protease [Sulfurovum sp. FS06-10]
MKSFLKVLSFIVIIFSLLEGGEVDASIVKIYTVSKTPNYLEPWNSTVERFSGSGSIIAGNRILTNAHVVANETFLEVKKYGDTKRYRAKVLFVSHESDLAILSVKEKSFFDNTEPLKLGNLPNIQDKVTVYGFPMGGNTISVSTGIVSRIEHNRYAHSGEEFLAIQIDAAINPGNSGGPAISNGKIVGIVMQGITFSQNIGYIVPVDVVQHFLNDIADGRYDGFPKLGIYIKSLENPTMKEYYHVDENMSGILVVDILYGSPLQDVLEKEDIIISINGHKIEDDGTVEFRPKQYTNFKYFIDALQVGDEVTLHVLRHGKEMFIKAKMNATDKKTMSFANLEYDKVPNYFIYGGYVFTPLTKNLLNSTRMPVMSLRYEAENKWPTEEKQEIVVLLKVLASSLSRGDYEISLWPIEKINGKTFKDFQDFYGQIKNFEGEFIVFEDEDGAKIVINHKDALKIQDKILERYGIKLNVSERLE